MVKNLEKLIITENKLFDSKRNLVNVEVVGKPQLLQRMHKSIGYNFIVKNAPPGSDAYTQGDQVSVTSNSLFDDATAYITAVQYYKKK